MAVDRGTAQRCTDVRGSDGRKEPSPPAVKDLKMRDRLRIARSALLGHPLEEDAGGREDIDPDFWALSRRVEPFTLTNAEKQYALYGAVRHVVENAIPGDIVECGVWRGGASMLAALTLGALGDRSRTM